jgi:Tol biopolymer transport system component
LWILPFQSGTARRIQQGYLLSVSWFPDNRRLLLTRDVVAKNSTVALDTSTGQERTIWTSPESLGRASISPDGKRIVFNAGTDSLELVEVSLADAGISTLIRGAISDWAPPGLTTCA